MKFTQLHEETIKVKAQQNFAGKYIEMDHCDLFLEDIVSGEITIEGIDTPLYVNTNYVYEDHLVNNNKTRYKLSLTLITIKNDPYEVIYDSRGKSYVAYEDNGVHFVLYEEWQMFLKPYIHIKTENNVNA